MTETVIRPSKAKTTPPPAPEATPPAVQPLVAFAIFGAPGSERLMREVKLQYGITESERQEAIAANSAGLAGDREALAGALAKHEKGGRASKKLAKRREQLTTAQKQLASAERGEAAAEDARRAALADD